MGNIVASIFNNIFALFKSTNLRSTCNKNICTKSKGTCLDKHVFIEQTKVVSYLPEKSTKQRKGKSSLHKVFYCSSCKISLYNQNLLKCHCMLHLHKKYSLYDIIQFKFDEGQIIINCIFCKKTMYSEKELSKHLELQSHIKNVRHFSYIDNIENNLNLSDCNTYKLPDNTVLKSVDTHIGNLIENIFCEWCQILIKESDINVHINEEEHHKKMMKYENKKRQNKSQIFVMDHTTPKFYTCFICLDLSFNTLEQLFQHLNEKEHRYRIRIFKQIMNIEQINNSLHEVKFYCQLCLVNINGSIIEHLPVPFMSTKMISSYNLSNIMKNMISKQKNDNTDKKLLENDLKTDIQIMNQNFVTYKDNKYYCNICDYTTTKSTHLCTHILSDCHKKKLVVAKSKSSEKPEHSILLRNTKVESNAVSIYQNVSSKASNFENFSFLQSYKSSLLVNDELNELIDFDLDNINPRISNINKKLKQYKTVHLNSSFSLDKDKVSAYANKFIELCLKPGVTNIYHINDEVIHLLQAGINLTVPFNSEKRVCIPCQCKFFNCYLYDHLHCHEHIQNLSLMAGNYSREPLSDQNLCQFYIIKYPNNWIFCYACGTYGYVTDDVIINHISSENHILRSLFCKTYSKITFEEIVAISTNLWYYVHVFVCNICDKRFKIEFDFIAHLESKKHKENCSQFSNIKLNFGICPVCVTCWYGEQDTYSKHCLNDFHKRFLTSNEFMVPEMSKLAVELLNEPDLNVNNLLNESNKTVNLSKNKEIELLELIEKCVKPIYPKAKAYLYGSRLSHQGFLNSDVDIFLDCENNYYYAGSKNQSEVYLKSVSDLLDTKKENWIIDEMIVGSRVPILKLRHLFTNSKCDISFTNGLCVEKSKLIKYYNVSFPICRQLILFLKKWLHFCQLSGSTGINTYALTWFVIFYLQREKIVPTVYQLLKKSNSSLIVGGWECATLNINEISDTNFAFREILKGFFLFYGAFDYQFKIVCPFVGESIDKYIFAEMKQLPEKMKNYIQQVRSGKIKYFRFDSPMCIQDPVDHSQNITKAVSKLQLRSFRKYCTESAVLLSYKETVKFEN